MVITDWLEWTTPFRQIAVYFIWIMFPVQLWSVWRTNRQHQQWTAEEAARRERWKEDMAISNKMREEAANLRASAEVALAQARQEIMRANQRLP